VYVVAAIITAAAVVIAAVVGNRKLNRIEVLVNGRLDEALEELKALKAERDAQEAS
jgi:hypothetical protein